MLYFGKHTTFRFGYVCAFDAPFGGVEVVGAVAYVLFHSEREALVCHYDKSARCSFGQRNGFLAQEVDGFCIAEFHLRIGVDVELSRQSERLIGYDVASLLGAKRYASVHNLKR